MIIIQDDILPRERLLQIRQSALQGGFGTWSPPTHRFGKGYYEGMGFKGDMASLHASISSALGRPIYPNASFFRASFGDKLERLIHSDRNSGDYTAIVYLSEHDHENHGTSFFLHRASNKREMPTLQELEEAGTTEEWNKDMLDESKWEQLDVVRGLFGRLLIFSAPMFHGRFPAHGFGDSPETGRMAWVCHFMT